MYTVDHPYKSLNLLDCDRPMPLAGGTNGATLFGREITLETQDLCIVVVALDNGENATDLFEHDKYGPHLGAAEMKMLLDSRSPVALLVYSGRITEVVPKNPENIVGSSVRVGSTLAFEDQNRFETGGLPCPS